MKKRVLYLLLGISILGSMTGCSTAVKEKAAVSTEESVESILPDSYEKQHREVREPVYRTAATSFAGGDGSESSPYEISSAEELQYLSDLLSDEENRSSDYRNGQRYDRRLYILRNDNGCEKPG